MFGGLLTLGLVFGPPVGQTDDTSTAGWLALLTTVIVPTLLWIWREWQLREQECETEYSYRQSIYALASAVDAGDPFTRGRPYRTARFCLAIGKRLKMSASELRDLEYAALLHDIGRTAIHNDILQKPTTLTEGERATMRTHPQIGYDILKQIPRLAGAAELVLSHHEQPNGKGYPLGLADAEIRLGAKIIMVVAAFDAMTSDRPYRSGLDTTDAYEGLRSSVGVMFDERVVEALVELHQSGAIYDEFDATEMALYASDDRSVRSLSGFEPEPQLNDGSERNAEGAYEIDLEPELAEQIDAALNSAFGSDDRGSDASQRAA